MTMLRGTQSPSPPTPLPRSTGGEGRNSATRPLSREHRGRGEEFSDGLEPKEIIMPVDTVTITSVVCVVLLLVSLFFLLFAASSFAYPQSSTTVEVYPADVSPPRQWRTILIMMGIAALSAGLAVAVCMARSRP